MVISKSLLQPGVSSLGEGMLLCFFGATAVEIELSGCHGFCIDEVSLLFLFPQIVWCSFER